MSINVTVKGNPISIKRGRIVSYDPDYARNEFETRRRIRLQQVREQSKVIAEDVRKRVRKEALKQLSAVEKTGEREHRKWQDRKLLELQQNYREALDNIGLGHAQAALETDSIETIAQRKNTNDGIAHERGKKALHQLQTEKNEKSREKSIPIQTKKFTRAVEDTRASMVSNINKNTPSKKKKRKKRLSTDINISTLLSDSNLEEPNEDVSTSSSSTTSSTLRSPKRPRTSPSTITEESTRFTSRSEKPQHESTRKSRSREDHKKTLENKERKRQHEYSRKRHSQEDHRETLEDTELKQSEALKMRDEAPILSTKTLIDVPMDTRISDRIRSRNLTSRDCQFQTRPCNCDSFIPKEPRSVHCECLIPPKPAVDEERIAVSSSKFSLNPELHTRSFHQREAEKHPEKYCGLTKPCYEKNETEEIPVKPTVSLKNIQATGASHGTTKSDFSKVQYYDHANRFTKQYLADNSDVHKIQDKSLEVCPSHRSETKFREQMFKRDRDAETRGKKALEKEKIHRDYKEIMQKLPGLQRQERIASIGSDKPVLHMNKDRLKHYELERQNRMENAYEKLFPNTPMITIPQKKHDYLETNLLPFRAIDETQSPPTLNVGAWDVNAREEPIPVYAPVAAENSFLRLSENSGNEQLTNLEQEIRNGKASLKIMMEKLKAQREKQAREVSSLQKDDDLHKLPSELREITGEARGKSKDKLKKSEYSNSTGLSKDCEQKRNVDRSRERGKEKTSKSVREVCSSSDSGSSAAPKSASSKRRARDCFKPIERIILQNTSTQTSPSIDAQKPAQDLPKTEKELPSGNEPSTSNDTSDKLCEIVIKISENEPQIYINPPKDKSKQIPIKTTRDIEPDKAKHLPKSKHHDVLKKPATALENLKNRKPLITPKLKPSQSKSWREHFTQNSSTSTSYYSPPDFSAIPQADNTIAEASASRHISILQPQVQQSNLENSASSSETARNCGVNSKLAKTIKKLLTMSHASIDDLGVSTVSEMSTPASDIVGTVKNKPLVQLQNLLKFFNINGTDLEQYLNYSTDGSQVHYNTAESLTLSSSNGSHTALHRTTENISQEVMTSQLNKEQITAQISPGETGEELMNYNKLFEISAKRIDNLNVLIDKVRLEKISQNLSCNSDKENSTLYLDLPKTNKSSPTSDSSAEQREFDRQMLAIDFNLAEELKRLTEHQQIGAEHTGLRSGMVDTVEDDVDKELTKRFRRLAFNQSAENSNEQTTGFALTQSKVPESQPKETIKDLPFVPLLTNIPRLPKFEKPAKTVLTSNGAVPKNGRGKPPLSKDVATLRRFNNNITIQPHELSVITEGDSEVSAQLPRSKTPEEATNRRNSLLHKEQIDSGLKQVILFPTPADQYWLLKKPEEVGQKSSSSDDMPDLLSELMDQATKNNESEGMAPRPQKESNGGRKSKSPVQGISDKSRKSGSSVGGTSSTLKDSAEGKDLVQKTSSESNSSSDIEAVIRSLGIPWAIPTLKRTKAADALTSSSSSGSLEAGMKPSAVNLIDSSNSSKVSLRDFLTKGSWLTLSSSSSDLSPYLREMQNWSAIQESTTSKDKTNQRTSTPVLAPKSDNKSKNESQQENMFGEDSELSSVRVGSDEHVVTSSFVSLKSNETESVYENTAKND